ncbi:MAG: hypothetical protein ACYTXY_54030, partial [Nostoc sp.]
DVPARTQSGNVRASHRDRRQRVQPDQPGTAYHPIFQLAGPDGVVLADHASRHDVPSASRSDPSPLGA